MTKTSSVLRILKALVVFVLLALAASAESNRSVLHGEWFFALDPLDVGGEQQWFSPTFPDQKWDKVTVPHCFSVDPRYHKFTGTTWYRRHFRVPRLSATERVFLRFEAVFYQAEVWLNNQRIGTHEGGYTPFEFDVTGVLEEDNVLVVRVNNAWSTATLPGAKPRAPRESLNSAQVYPWMNYGGITREVALIVRPEVYLANVKIEAVPDLIAKNARLRVQAFVQNTSEQPWESSQLRFEVKRAGRAIPLVPEFEGGKVAPGSRGVIRIEATLAAEEVQLWHFDAPALYQAAVSVGGETTRVDFGIRKVEIQGTQLLLNGEPVALGGSNRPLDSPSSGSMDPPELLEQDMRLMKSGGMELSRLSHYPVSSQLLDWADRHGVMIIAEAGNWQLTPEQMADSVIRKKFEAQMREMVERDWNHPSIIAWSVGNEYQSETEAGLAWTRDMCDFTRALDSSRLLTFASNMVFRPVVKRAEDEASRYVDFISANIYVNHLESLQRIHELYPGKPVYVSEFGLRADAVKSEEERVAHLQQVLAVLRQCDFVIGASIWTFNDYASLFPGSDANGYRPWGLVTADRQPRKMYYVWKEEMSPAVVETHRLDDGRLEVTVTARADFPRYTLRDYTLRLGDRVLPIPALKPGVSHTFRVSPDPEAPDRKIVVAKPGGFRIFESTY